MNDGNLFEATMESFPDGIIIAGNDNKIVFVNTAAEKIRKISREEKIGKSILDCHKPSSLEKVSRALSYLKEKKGVFRRMVTDTENGRIYENTYQAIHDQNGNMLGSMVVSKDITDKCKAEEDNRNYNQRLKLEISSLTEKLDTLFFESLNALVYTLEAKDIYTKGHSERVTNISSRFVQEVFGQAKLFADVELAAKFHDIGKIGIPEAILNKPGKLTPEETELMRQHPVITEQILSPFDNLKEVITIAKHHHERYDGGGYPDKLAGENIPLGSRILALADSYDAMTSTRPYRKSLKPEDAVKIINDNLATQFDPSLGKEFIELVETGTI
ncbi:MAG: HD domain-containing phosphohydrolase [Treponema sp.]